MWVVDMRKTFLLGAVWFIVLLELSMNRALAQETLRAAIPLFPTAAFPLLVANDRGFFQKEGRPSSRSGSIARRPLIRR